MTTTPTPRLTRSAVYPITTIIAARARGAELGTTAKARYSRHLLLPEIGMDGQLRLKSSRVLIVGLGGLGAPASLYLAAAGVGTLGLVEFDQVEASNLQRQILYTEADVGASKLATAAARLSQLNSAIVVEQHAERIDPSNVARLVAGYDLVVDGTDNFATRFLLSDTCAQLAKPYIYGSILRFAGQASVFYPPHGPCYRCLFPRSPGPGEVPSCGEGGVLGVLPAQIGAIQATEAIKMLLGIGTPLIGRLLTFDALAMSFSEYRLERDPECSGCGAAVNKPKSGSAKIDDVASAPACAVTPAADLEMSPAEFYAMRTRSLPHVLIDVRTAAEFAICHIQGSRLIPLDELPQRLGEIPEACPVIVHCKAGARSLKAVALMRSAGLHQARSLQGGILAWADAYAPELARY